MEVALLPPGLKTSSRRYTPQQRRMDTCTSLLHRSVLYCCLLRRFTHFEVPAFPATAPFRAATIANRAGEKCSLAELPQLLRLKMRHAHGDGVHSSAGINIGLPGAIASYAGESPLAAARTPCCCTERAPGLRSGRSCRLVLRLAAVGWCIPECMVTMLGGRSSSVAAGCSHCRPRRGSVAMRTQAHSAGRETSHPWMDARSGQTDRQGGRGPVPPSCACCFYCSLGTVQAMSALQGSKARRGQRYQQQCP